MTVEEALARAPGKLIIHRGSVFFNTRDENVKHEWEDLGALTVPWYTDGEMAYRKFRRLSQPEQGWEVHLTGAIDPIWIEDTDGSEINVTRDVLLTKARELVAA